MHEASVIRSSQTPEVVVVQLPPLARRGAMGGLGGLGGGLGGGSGEGVLSLDRSVPGVAGGVEGGEWVEQ